MTNFLKAAVASDLFLSDNITVLSDGRIFANSPPNIARNPPSLSPILVFVEFDKIVNKSPAVLTELIESATASYTADRDVASATLVELGSDVKAVCTEAVSGSMGVGGPIVKV